MNQIEQIKAAADCRAYLRDVLQVKVIEEGKEWWRFACPPWRPDSDSGGFVASKTGWKDHATEESGSIIDLVAKTKTGADVKAAIKYLAELYNIQERQEVAAYNYRNTKGELVFQVVRFEPKDFRQRRPDGRGGFIWNMHGVERIPYRLESWPAEAEIIVTAGEKDVRTFERHGFIATTLPGGEGKWQESYAQWFKGKDVTIFPDNDKKGAYHAALVAWGIREVAKRVRIVVLSKLPKGDVTDWFNREKGSEAQIKELMEAAPALELNKLRKPDPPKDGRAKSSPETGKAGGRPKIKYAELAEHFVRLHKIGKQFLYRRYKGAWHLYDGRCYQKVSTADIQSRIYDFLQEHYHDHSNVNVMQNVLGNLTSTRHGGILSWRPMPCWLDANFQPADGWLALKNKILNVYKAADAIGGQAGGSEKDLARELTPDLFSTFGMSYEFDPEATCPLWQKYLEGVQPEPQDRAVLQMLTGLALIPETRYNVGFFFYGEAGTGKSVFLHVLHGLVGEANVCCVPLSDFGHRFATWPLTCNLLNIVGDLPTETDQGGHVSAIEGMFKDATSGGLVPIEFKGEDRYEGRVIARCVFAANDLPRFYDRSNAIWDRLRIVAFDQVFRGTPREDPTLKDKIVGEELPGIFIWALQGLAALLPLRQFPEHTRGLEIKEEHRAYCDPEGQFLVETYELATESNDGYVETKTLYDEYREYAKSGGFRFKSLANFNRAVERVFKVRKERFRNQLNHEVRAFRGIRRQPNVPGGSDDDIPI